MKTKLILVMIFLVIPILGVGFYFLSQPPKEKLSNEFKEKAITQLLGRKAQLDDDSPTGEIEYKGKSITFKYPARALKYEFREKSSSTNSAALDDFSFDIKEPKMVFNLLVLPNSSNLTTIEEYPAVRLRESRLYEYRKSVGNLSTIKGVVYAKEDNGAEKSGFWLVDDKIYSIAITGVDLDAVSVLFDSILASSKIK